MKRHRLPASCGLLSMATTPTDASARCSSRKAHVAAGGVENTAALSTVGTFRIWLPLLQGLIFGFKERVPASVGSSVAGDSAYRPRVCRVTAPRRFRVRNL